MTDNLKEAQVNAQEESTEVVGVIAAQVDTEVAYKEETAPTPLVESREVLYDAWNRPIPTELFLIESISYPDLITKLIHAGTLGAKLNPTKRILLNSWPYRIHLMLPTYTYKIFEAGSSYPFFNEGTEYNKITVRAFSQQRFIETVLEVACQGVVWEPSSAIIKSPKFSVKLLTRAPIAPTQNILVGLDKVSYSKDELSAFDIKQLTLIGSWYGLSFKSKDKYIKGILDKQQ